MTEVLPEDSTTGVVTSEVAEVDVVGTMTIGVVVTLAEVTAVVVV